MRILSIETSCDDTSMAIVEVTEPKNLGRTPSVLVPHFKVLKNLVSSQTKIHSHWGGVVPNLAKREHLKNLPILWKRIMNKELRIKNKKSMIHNSKFVIPDLLAVTVGPGLEPSLWTGVEFAKKLSAELKIPLVGVNHLEGHLYSFLLPQKTVITNIQYLIPKNKKLPLKLVEELPKLEIGNWKLEFPAVALLVSGGHTILVVMKNLKTWKKIGETRDDAAGEAYDKVAKMMSLPYPGGPLIEKLAKKGNGKAIAFPRPMMREKNYEFSFSGLKTSVLYYLKSLVSHPERSEGSREESSVDSSVRQLSDFRMTAEQLSDVSASFQFAVIDVLTAKTIRAVREFGAKSVFLCGGVAANKTLRKELKKAANAAGAEFFAPDFEYNTDNAAMIAVAAYLQQKSRRKKYPLVADSGLTL